MNEWMNEFICQQSQIQSWRDTKEGALNQQIGWTWTTITHFVSEMFFWFQKCFWSRAGKFEWRYRPTLLATKKCSPVSLLSRSIRFMRIFAGIPCRTVGVKLQWVLETAIFSAFAGYIFAKPMNFASRGFACINYHVGFPVIIYGASRVSAATAELCVLMWSIRKLRVGILPTVH